MRESVKRSRINAVIEEMVKWGLHAPQHSAATRRSDYAELTCIPIRTKGPSTKGLDKVPLITRDSPELGIVP